MPVLAVYVTVQLAVPPVPIRVQLVWLKTPLPLLFQSTVPVGVIAVPSDVSVTVAVHCVSRWGLRTVTEQLTLVEVVRCATVILVVPELASWAESPL